MIRGFSSFALTLLIASGLLGCSFFERVYQSFPTSEEVYGGSADKKPNSVSPTTTTTAAATPISPPSPEAEVSDSDEPSQVPFVLKVLNEANDGKRLMVRGAVSAKAAWKTDAIVIRLTGLQEGKIIETSEHKLTEIISADDSGPAMVAAPEQLGAGSEVKFVISIPSVAISHYQIELLWGKDAQDAEPEVVPAPAVGKLEVRGLHVDRQEQHCQDGICSFTLTVTAELSNQGAAPITQAVLGVSYVRQNGEGQSNPNLEDQLEVGTLNLQPGDSRAVRLLLEHVPKEAVEGYHPVLRVISAQ